MNYNFKWDSEDILDVVLHATVRKSCIEDASNSVNLRKPRVFKKFGIELESVPDANTILRRVSSRFVHDTVDESTEID